LLSVGVELLFHGRPISDCLPVKGHVRSEVQRSTELVRYRAVLNTAQSVRRLEELRLWKLNEGLLSAGLMRRALRQRGVEAA
jgi:hypothetical protein